MSDSSHTPTPKPEGDAAHSPNPEATSKPENEATSPATPATAPEPSATAPGATPDQAHARPNDYAWQANPQASPQAPGKPDKPEKRGNIGIIAALAVGALVGGISGAGVYAIATNNDSGSATTPSGSGSTNITVNDPGNASLVTAVAAAAAPSVVTISVAGESASGTGSGVVLDEEGHVLTNAHVATLSGETSDPAIRVQMADGRLYPATLVGSDPIADLAVIKIEADVEFEPIEFADSDKLNVGDAAIALGAPLGLANTVTSGIISALNRSITVASSAAPEMPEGEAPAPDDENGPFDFWEFDNRDEGQGQQSAPRSTIALPVIQTDAAINPGNSGGALLDSDGNVIGINVAIASTGGSSQDVSGSIGVGFAIPSNLAERVAGELIEDGKASHGLLGASVRDVTEDETIESSATVGSSIWQVTPGGAADQAGIRKGDVVVEFNGMPITGKTDLTAQVRVLPGGADAELTYVRDGKTETVTVTLGELE